MSVRHLPVASPGELDTDSPQHGTPNVHARPPSPITGETAEAFASWPATNNREALDDDIHMAPQPDSATEISGITLEAAVQNDTAEKLDVPPVDAKAMPLLPTDGSANDVPPGQDSIPPNTGGDLSGTRLTTLPSPALTTWLGALGAQTAAGHPAIHRRTAYARHSHRQVEHEPSRDMPDPVDEDEPRTPPPGDRSDPTQPVPPSPPPLDKTLDGGTDETRTPSPGPSPVPGPASESPPTYPEVRPPATVGKDVTVRLPKSSLIGENDEHAPAHIRITAITPKNGSTDHPALVLNHGEPGERVLSVGDEISLPDFDKLSWDTTNNDGGSFSFLPLDDRQQPFEGVGEQTVQIIEHPAPPVYADQPPELFVAHDGTLKLDPLHLTGTDISRKPDFVRITALEVRGAADGSTPGALVQAVQFDSEGNRIDSPVILKAGDVVPFAAFRHLIWQADGNEGGHFSFVPSLADGTTLLGSTEQRIHVTEDPLTPVYPNDNEPLVVAHDGTLTLGALHLIGEDVSRRPAFIRITAIDEAGHPDDHQGLPTALILPGQVDDTGTLLDDIPITLAVGDIVPFAAFRHLQWQATDNAGGSFRFVPSADNGRALAGATEQTLHVRESSHPPDYQLPGRLDVGRDQEAPLPTSLLAGAVDAHAPGSILIRTIQLDEAPTGAPPLAADADERSLFLLHNDGQRNYLKAGDSIGQADFARLHWDGSVNQGGSLIIEPREADGNVILGAQPRSISIIEHPAPPQYEPLDLMQLLAHDAEKAIGDSLFANGRATAPTHVRIEAILPENAADDQPVLTLNGQPVQAPLVLSRDEAAALHWHAHGNDGGSIHFTPVLPDGTPILGATPQVLQVHESPLPPVYAPDAQIHVAHDGSRFLPVELLAGTDGQRAPSFIYITLIQPTADAGEASAPALWLDRDGLAGNPGTAIAIGTDGTLIPFADLAHLRWDASHNQGGLLRFAPLDAQRLPIIGADGRAISVEITIHESPVAPDYASTPLLVVGHDQTLPLPASVFAGDDPAHKPPKIRITAIHENGDQLDGKSPLFFLSGPGDGIGNRVYLKEGQEIPAGIYDRLQWDAQVNDGGHFTITALDAQGAPIEGSLPRTITVHESPVPPHHSPHNTPTPVGHNGEAGFALSQLQGVVSSTDGSLSPSTGYIRITAIDETKDLDPQASPLYLTPASPGGEITRITVGSRIAVADLGRLRWHAGLNDGGSFQFMPQDASGHDIVGATAQRIEIYESPVPPSYPDSYRQTVTVAHDSAPELDGRIFAGDTPHTAPAFIRIESLSEAQDLAPGRSALILNRGRADEREIKVGSIVAQADFHNLSWDAASNDGGSFSFRALDRNQRNIVGSRTMQITVNESPALPPVYDSYGVDIRLGHDQIHHFDAAIFTGSDPQRAPSGVWIEKVSENNDTAPNKPALMLDRSLPTERPLTLVGTSMVLSAADFGKLSWDASANTGGSFRFHPLDKHNNLLVHGQVITVTVHESPRAPAYASDGSTVRVAHDSTTGLAPTLFTGSQPADAPRYLRITGLSETGDTDTAHSALMANRGGANGRELRVGDVVTFDEFNHLSWNAASNQGGHFSFVALDAGQHVIIGAREQRITIEESPPVPEIYSSNIDKLNRHIAHDSTEDIAKRFIFGDRNPAPHVRIEGIQENADTQPGVSPLRLVKTDGSSLAVNDGDTIAAADFRSLQWSAAHNAGGSFRVVFLDNNRQDIVGATARTATMIESPEAPAYSTQPIRVAVPHEGTVKLNPNLFAGADPAKKPAYIRIDSIQSGVEGSKQQALNGSASGLRLDQDSGGQKIYLNGGSANNGGPIILPINDVGKLSWNAADNAGGQIRFTALDANRQSIVGAERPIIVFDEEVPPHLPAPPPPQSTPDAPVAGHNRTTYLDKSVFIGNAPGATTAGRFFKITKFFDYEHAAVRDNQDLRKINYHPTVEHQKPTAYELVQVSGGITKAEAQARARAANGKLLTLDESPWYTRDDDLNDTQKPQSETVWVGRWLSAFGLSSEYSLLDGSKSFSFDVHHAGSDDVRLNAFVIEYQDYHSPLRLHNAQDSSQATDIWEGQIVGEDELERISWDTRLNNGGNLRFEEVMGREVTTANASGNQIRPGTSERIVLIRELSSDGISVTQKGPQSIRHPASLKLRDLLDQDDSPAHLLDTHVANPTLPTVRGDTGTANATPQAGTGATPDSPTIWKGVDLHTLLDERLTHHPLL